MNTKELGEKIKALRLAKKMTQNEVVGNFITRNMLSQIESGTAMPSMRTLEYLAGVFGVSVSFLVPGEEGDEICTLVSIKQALINKKYDEVILRCPQLPSELEDEANALLTRAHWELAKAFTQNQEYRLAVQHAKLAAEKAQKGVYASMKIRTNALLLLDELGDKN